jgi:hypothetical protein
MTMESLETQIADLLKAPDGVPSAKFGIILFLINSAITATEREGRAAQAAAYDPAVLDPTAVGKAHDAEHRLKRLRNAATALTSHYTAAIKREEAAVWNAEAEEIEMKVAQLADELIGAYQRAAAQLVDIFLRISDMDAEVRSVNTKPGKQRALRTTEEVARDIDGFNPADSIVKNCALPELVIGSKAHPKMLWPPPPVNHALQYALDVGRMLSGPALPPTAEQRAVEAKRMTDFYTEQERGRERLNSEAAARDAARRRQA